MKAAIVAILILSLFGLNTALAQVSIKDTKHNLSVSSPGTLKAQSEQEICVFCHTPHNSSATAQLWNRQPTAASYTLYSSEYLTSKTYSTPAQPNAKSKLCMSCHDGTIALGSVYNTSGGGTTSSISMSGGITTMPTGSSGYIGIALTDDHPVGYNYDNTKEPELVVRAWPWNTAVKLDPDASTGKVECHTCHEPHNNQNTKFLRISNSNAGLCTFCHNKTGWSTAIHKNSTQSYTLSGGTATTIGEWSCRNCHKSHGGTGIPYILQSPEENTCYASSCHGSVSPGANTKDIQSALNKTYRHPTNFVSAKHINPDNSTSLNAPNRHAECQDCHNPHQAKDGLHLLKSNAVSNVLAGVKGVTPGSATIWTQPTTFTANDPVSAENQICFKCHSYNGFGSAPNGVTTILGPSGINITDQAMEFNSANKSAHPAQVSSNNQTGSTAPKALAVAQMTATWNSVGTQTMYCSDCHGNDQTVSTTIPDGPHGSTQKFMLKGTNQFWPTKSDGVTLWALNDFTTTGPPVGLFCVNCHPMKSGATWQNNVHREHAPSGINGGGQLGSTRAPCVMCHLAVPHGSKRGRLIGYTNDVAPRKYSGTGLNTLVLLGFKKATGPNNYNKSNCYSTQSGCTTHWNQGGYDQ